MAEALRERPRELLVSGHVNVDRFFSLPRFPPPDRTVPVLRERVVLGGTAGTIARTASHYGVRTGLIARLGDAFPESFRRQLRRDGIDLRGLTSLRGVPTPTAYVLEEPGGAQRTLMAQGAMADGIRAQGLSWPWIGEYAWVHLTTGPPDLQLGVARQARATGVRIAADPAQEVYYRWDARRLARLLRDAEIVFGNRAEIARIAAKLDLPGPRALAAKVPLVVRTEGPRGASAFSRTGTVHVPARPVRHVGSVVGAGDRFRGGFYAAWFAGHDLTGCLRAGVVAAARGLEEGPLRPELRR